MRMRVQGRQTYVFAEAGRLGWAGDWRRPVEAGLGFMLDKARLPSGLMAHRFAQDGASLDPVPDLYDQSFALLGLASAYAGLEADEARQAAYALLAALTPYRLPGGGYRELRADAEAPVKANPHMHLFEAAQAWSAVDPDGPWPEVGAELAELCCSRLIDPETGALREFFDENWRPAPPPLGDQTELGHYLEWSWLLVRHGGLEKQAKALAERGEALGVDPKRKVAINVISLSGRPLDLAARLWPQTERLKAALAHRRCSPRWNARALEAVDSWLAYTRPVRPGLWLDWMEADGSMRPEPAPASSFYHLIGAISHLTEAAIPV
jgi:mannose-6-phosphate isomerase